MNVIAPGMAVEISYDLYTVENGTKELVHQVPADNPERMIYGVTPHVIKPLAEAIEGLKAGDSFSATITPAEGFGEYTDELLRTELLPRQMFEPDGKLDEETIYPGAQIYLQTNFGQEVPAVVLEVGNKEISVKVDLNHPLAGKTIVIKGKILSVRPATDEEIAQVQAASCGCGGCGCGSDCSCEGGCDYGDSCDCDSKGCEGGCCK